MNKVVLHPIGVLRTPFRDLAEMPIQPTSTLSAPGTAEIFTQYRAGLQDLAGFSHLILLYHLHKAEHEQLQVTPFLDRVPRGVYATRAPTRPNHLGLSIVELLRVDGTTLHLNRLDMLDGTPLLDIKPYVPAFDEPQDVRCGWLENAPGQVRAARSDKRFTSGNDSV